MSRMFLYFLLILAETGCRMVLVGGVWLTFSFRLDMTLKILDILEGIEERGEFRVAGWGNRETWARDVERCAPGYLELEASGREVEFDMESLQKLVRY